MKRLHNLNISNNSYWDFIIIGGGATGLGTALDAASRGYKTLLIEQSDFAKGTSSRSTKLVHGGVRYLAQGDIGLVKHALRERALMKENAAHLVNKEEFIIPCYTYFDVLQYFIGLKLYDWLAGKYSFGKSKFLSKNETLKLMPRIKAKGLKGAIKYFDGKFDDARLAINIAQTAVENGATLANYMKVTNLLKNGKIVNGVTTVDAITGETYNLNAKVVVNATGVFVDDILQMIDPASKKLVRPSQGVHLVLDKKFLKSEFALMIPKTSDGRVLFAVQWHERVLVGTTDTPVDEHSLEPRALKEEINFILSNAKIYLNEAPTEKDILSVFAGLRPLVAPKNADGSSTKKISRDHKLMVSAEGLITITGGKWTTYRLMAEETVNLAAKNANLTPKECITKELKIHGCTSFIDINHLNSYGSDRVHIENLIKLTPELATRLHPDFPYTEAEIFWSARNEMAETVEDLLSRRLRVLFIDATAAIAMAPRVATILAKELNADKIWVENQIATFTTLANGYIYQTKNNIK